MQLDLDLRTYLAAHLVAGTPIEQNKIAEDYATNPAVMFTRRPSTQDVLLSGAQPSIAETEYDVEVYGIDIDAVQTLADTLVAPYAAGGLLNGFQGAMGATTVLAAFCSDHADDYTPKVELNTDEGLHVVTFALSILH